MVPGWVRQLKEDEPDAGRGGHGQNGDQPGKEKNAESLKCVELQDLSNEPLTMEQHTLKNVNNGRGSTVNRVLDGSTYPG